MNIDLALLGFDDNEPVPQPPRTDDLESMDAAFENVDFAIAEDETFAKRSSADDADTILMQLPRGKVARVSKRRMQACTTPQQLRALDRDIYSSAGLDPSAFGL